MIPMDTWAVTEITDDSVMAECPFTGGWDYLKADELNDLSDEGRKIFEDYIKRKEFRYSNIAEYGFIADR